MSYAPRIFYDAEVPELTSMNIAEMMAKQGVKTDSDSGQVPDIKIEQKQPDPPPPPAPEKVETTPEPVKTEVKAEPVQTPAVDVKAPTWQEVLSNSRPDTAEVLKALGFDEKMTGFLNTWRSNGNVNDYLRAAMTDYTKMTSEEVLREQLRRDFSDWSQEDFTELCRAKITEHYKLDPDLFTPEEVKRGQLLLNADAKKVRDQLIQDQKQFILDAKAPEPEIPQELVDFRQREDEREQKRNVVIESIKNNPVTQEFYKNKTITIGTGETSFKYEVNPDDVINMLVDPVKVTTKLFNADGSPNMANQLIFGAIVADGDNFLKLYGDHMKKIGAREVNQVLENASVPGAQPTKDNSSLDPVAALARGGMITTG